MFKKLVYLFLLVASCFLILHSANSQSTLEAGFEKLNKENSLAKNLLNESKNTVRQSSLEAGFEKLNQENPISKSKSSGGGIDAALTEIELNEKAKKTQQAVQNIQRYSNDYNRQDKEMANKCACHGDYTRETLCVLTAVPNTPPTAQEEENYRIYKAKMVRVCNAWYHNRSDNKTNFLQQVNQLQANYQQTVKDYQETEKKLALEIEKKRQQYIADQQQEVLQQQQREKQKLLDREAEMKQLCQLKEHSGMCYCSSYVKSSGSSCGK